MKVVYPSTTVNAAAAAERSTLAARGWLGHLRLGGVARRLRGSSFLLALPLLAGCAFKRGDSALAVGIPATVTSTTQAPAGQPGQADNAAVERWYAAVKAQGVLPVAVEVLTASEDPASGWTVEAATSTLERYRGTVGDDGYARMQLPSLSMARWRVFSPALGWAVVQAPLFAPARDGTGIRGLIRLPPFAPPAQATPTPARPASETVVFPSEVTTPDQQVEWLVRQINDARRAGDAAREKLYGDELARRFPPSGGGK